MKYSLIIGDTTLSVEILTVYRGNVTVFGEVFYASASEIDGASIEDVIEDLREQVINKFPDVGPDKPLKGTLPGWMRAGIDANSQLKKWNAGGL